MPSVTTVSNAVVTHFCRQLSKSFRYLCRSRQQSTSVLTGFEDRPKPVDFYASLEPPYLQYRGPPLYDSVNVRLQGHDFATLESFWKYIPKTCETLQLSVVHRWAAPGADSKVQILREGAETVDDEYKLTLFDRYVQLASVPNQKIPLLIKILRENLPAGVMLTIKEAEESDEKVRFMPDKELLALKDELDELASTKVKKIV